MVGLRPLLLLTALVSMPLHAQQTSGPDYDPLADARSMVEAHVVSDRTGCSVPVPATWNAPSWEQDAAMRRRVAFEQCLERAYNREYDRLERLSDRVAYMRQDFPDLDWSGVDYELDMKWNDLDRIESKIASQMQWADTAVTILDTFTGPGAPLDSSPLNPAHNPYGYPASGPYRPNTSVSAPGIP